MSSNNPVSDAAEGITKGVLEWSSEKIASWVKKFRDRKLAFIQDQKTIEVVKEQYNSGETKFYKNYIKDEKLLFLVRLGLTLRKLEEEDERLHNLRGKIFKKYNVEGLHIAEFAQNGVLNMYVGILLEELTSIQKLEDDIGELLKNIEKYTLFVQGTSKKADVIKTVDVKAKSHSPKIFIISGFKQAAKLVSESVDSIKIILEDYDFERFSGGEKEILFFKKKKPAT
ncbi:MAG: hypothetical protein Q7J54_07620 [Candidatus Woesearchaeota archaeon]|nr:hypothetical protein [Candidatus Woesearchaeota archaeon]